MYNNYRVTSGGGHKINCENLDDSYCKEHKQWCCLINKCQKKEPERPLRISCEKTLKRLKAKRDKK